MHFHIFVPRVASCFLLCVDGPSADSNENEKLCKITASVCEAAQGPWQ